MSPGSMVVQSEVPPNPESQKLKTEDQTPKSETGKAGNRKKNAGGGDRDVPGVDGSAERGTAKNPKPTTDNQGTEKPKTESCKTDEPEKPARWGDGGGGDVPGVDGRAERGTAEPRNPKSETQNPKSEAQDLKPGTRNPKPENRKPKTVRSTNRKHPRSGGMRGVKMSPGSIVVQHEAPNPGTRKPEPCTRNGKRGNQNLKTGNRNPKPETRTPKPETRNPKPNLENAPYTLNPTPETARCGVPTAARHPLSRSASLRVAPVSTINFMIL